MVQTQMPTIGNYINGNKTSSKTNTMSITAPQTGEVIGEVQLSSSEQVDAAVQVAKESFVTWSAETLKTRVQIFFRFRNFINGAISECCFKFRNQENCAMQKC